MIPHDTAVQAEVKIASTTEKMAYFCEVLLILSIISFKLLSVGRQNRPIRPKSHFNYLNLSRYCRY
jgi:hypothetical protein